MGNAIWLFTALPKWFLSAVLSPFSAGALTLIPAVGTVCLAIGIALAVRLRAKSLWVFVLPALISQAFVAVAGFFRGALVASAAEPILVTFLVVQLVLSLYLIYPHRKTWLPATLLAAFSISYAWHALFIASMAFTDSWL